MKKRETLTFESTRGLMQVAWAPEASRWMTVL